MKENRPGLRRSRDKVIAGVCGGIAEQVGWSANRVRLIYVIVSVVSAGLEDVLRVSERAGIRTMTGVPAFVERGVAIGAAMASGLPRALAIA